MLMLLKAGTKAFSAFNQNYRELANGDSFRPSDYQLIDMLATAIAAAAGYDVTPFIELCGLTLEITTKGDIAALAAKPLYPLYLSFRKANGIARGGSWGWTPSSGWWITANWRH